MEARDQCWVSFLITIHFVFETEPLPGPRAYQLDGLSSILLSLSPSAQFINLGFFMGEDDLTL